MKIHNLKLNESLIDKVMNGFKTFEFRKNDRDFQVGDFVHFINTDGSEINGNELIDGEYCFKSNNLFRITYVMKPDNRIMNKIGDSNAMTQIKDLVPLEDGWCVFSITRVKVIKF